MAWTAFEHLRGSGFAAPQNPAIIGMDRDVAAASLCGLAAIGLMFTQTRAFVGLTIVLAVAFMLSARHLAGSLDYDALTYVPIVAAALFVCWPRLMKVRQQ